VLPVTSILFVVGALAVVGAPPFGIFLTKIVIFSVGFARYPFIVGVVLALTAVLFIGFFSHISAMIFGQPAKTVDRAKLHPWLIIPPLVLLFLALYLTINMPSFLHILITNIASHY